MSSHSSPIQPQPGQLLSGVSVIVPALNAGRPIASAVQAAVRVAAQLSDDYEVIVLDGGTAHDTLSAAGQVTRIDPRLRLIVHTGIHTYGAALRAGIRAARKPWVMLTDGDLRIDPRAVEDLLRSAQRSDLVVGWRILRVDPVPERMRAAVWNRLVTRLFALQVHDPDCPLKLARRDLLEQLELTASDAMVGTELVVRSVAAEARVSEVPFREPARDTREAVPAPGALRSLAELTSLYRPLRRVGDGPDGPSMPSQRGVDTQDAAAA